MRYGWFTGFSEKLNMGANSPRVMSELSSVPGLFDCDVSQPSDSPPTRMGTSRLQYVMMTANAVVRAVEDQAIPSAPATKLAASSIRYASTTCSGDTPPRKKQMLVSGRDETSSSATKLTAEKSLPATMLPLERRVISSISSVRCSFSIVIAPEVTAGVMKITRNACTSSMIWKNSCPIFEPVAAPPWFCTWFHQLTYSAKRMNERNKR